MSENNKRKYSKRKGKERKKGYEEKNSKYLNYGQLRFKQIGLSKEIIRKLAGNSIL